MMTHDPGRIVQCACEYFPSLLKSRRTTQVIQQAHRAVSASTQSLRRARIDLRRTACHRRCWDGPQTPIETCERIIIMRTKLLVALTLLVLIGAAPLLGACHTTAGAGEDISATGHALTHSADRNTP